MSLMVVTKSSHQGSEECQNGCYDARRKSHLGLTDAMISLRVEIGNLICEWATEIRADKRPDER